MKTALFGASYQPKLYEATSSQLMWEEHTLLKSFIRKTLKGPFGFFKALHSFKGQLILDDVSISKLLMVHEKGEGIPESCN